MRHLTPNCSSQNRLSADSAHANPVNSAMRYLGITRKGCAGVGRGQSLPLWVGAPTEHQLAPTTAALLLA